MDWWNDFSDWTSSDTGWRVISGALIPFVAIVVAGVVAALIGRGATKRVVALHEREAKNAAVAAVITAARKAATWGVLGHDERNYADHLAEDADIRLRLLPVAGSPLAANWAQHEIADIKRNSSTFSFQAEQSLAEFRDRLLEWQSRPNRARKLFKSDLERWKFESPDPDADLIRRQQDWSADQADAKRPAAPEPTPTPTTTSLRPSPQRPAGTPQASASAGAGAATAVLTSSGSPATAPDPNATTPISDDTSADATRPYSDGVTRPYGDDQVAPIRPALGTPNSPARSTSAPDGDGQSSATSTWSRPVSASDHANADADSDVPRSDVPARPERSDDLAVGTGDTGGSSNTTSVPTRVHESPVEPADANETSEATYTKPISANELRRRAEDDE